MLYYIKKHSEKLYLTMMPTLFAGFQLSPVWLVKYEVTPFVSFLKTGCIAQ